MSRDLSDYILQCSAEFCSAEFSPHLRGSEKLMLLALADQVRDECEGVCWPSVELLAKLSSMQVRNAKLTLRKLEAAGEIAIEYGGQGKRDTNHYRVTCWNNEFFEWREEERKKREEKKAMGLSRKGAVLSGLRVQPSTPLRDKGVAHCSKGVVQRPKGVAQCEIRGQNVTPEPSFINQSIKTTVSEPKEKVVDDDVVLEPTSERSEGGGLSAACYPLSAQGSAGGAESADLPEFTDVVMEFYQWATGNFVTMSDYASFEPLAQAGELAWKIAICRSVILSRQKVRSLAYCAETLEGVLAEYEEAERRGLSGSPSQHDLLHLMRKIETPRRSKGVGPGRR